MGPAEGEPHIGRGSPLTMELAPFTRRVLVTIARDQFDESLQGIFSEIRGWHEGMPEQEELKLVQAAAREIMRLGLATFYRRRKGVEKLSEISPDETDTVLFNPANWYPRDEAETEEFYFVVTPEGFEEYQRGV